MLPQTLRQQDRIRIYFDCPIVGLETKVLVDPFPRVHKNLRVRGGAIPRLAATSEWDFQSVHGTRHGVSQDETLVAYDRKLVAGKNSGRTPELSLDEVQFV